MIVNSDNENKRLGIKTENHEVWVQNEWRVVHNLLIALYCSPDEEVLWLSG